MWKPIGTKLEWAGQKHNNLMLDSKKIDRRKNTMNR